MLVIDFGGQYSHLIARRVRESGVYSELAYPSYYEDAVRSLSERGWEVAGYILSGSPSSVRESTSHVGVARRVVGTGKPVLGICYGHQLLAKAFGGEVTDSCREYGPVIVEVVGGGPILKGLGGRLRVWMSHGDSVTRPPGGFKVLARSRCSIAAMGDEEMSVYSVQWHPEVTHSEGGGELIRNFVYDVCGCERSWGPDAIIREVFREASRLNESRGPVVAAVSGGVDSTVAALVSKAVAGGRVKPVILDTGLLREGEVEEALSKLGRLGIKPRVIDVSSRVFESLRGVVDPEEKRRVVGREYFKALLEYAVDIGSEFLVQGTIYPDVIESGARPGSDRIKSHHNVAVLPRDYPLRVVEPLRWLYKDEVRRIALRMGVPRDIVYKQPFPGPGLAIRVLGEVTREKVGIVRLADSILTDVLKSNGYYEPAWQAFTVLLNVRSTGVKGDRRAYGYVVAIRVVESLDGMTAKPVDIPITVLEEAASAISSRIPSVTRVVYDVTTKPPATIEWE